VRWEITRALAYSYLPVLLLKNKIRLDKFLILLEKIDGYVRNNKKVDSIEFKRIINNQL
jgi:hypothetical protein